MLAFLRKYQRIFFILITIVIVLVFSFFGTYDRSAGSSKKTKDKKLTKKLDGKAIYKSDLDDLSYFLSMENAKNEKIFLATNFLSDGVFAKDFIQTNIANVVAKKYFENFKDELNLRLEKIKKYQFYQHPRLSYISVKKLYEELNPEMFEQLKFVENIKDFNFQSFENYLKLYSESLKFSPDIIKRIILFQQNQAKGVEPDNSIYSEDFTLFNFKNLSDWFGQKYVDLLSQFILNAAAVSKEKGYTVTDDEAYFDLIYNFKQNIEKFDKNISKNFNEYFKVQLNALHLTEKRAIELWKNILFFKKYFNDVADSVISSSFIADEIISFSDEMREIEVYSLPKNLELKDFSDFLKLQTYLKAIRPQNDNNLLVLPKESATFEDIAKRGFADLLYNSIEIDVTFTNKDLAALKIGEKDLWEWQLQDKNFRRIRKQFSKFFINTKTNTRDERFIVLENLSDKNREIVDHFSRQEIIVTNKDLLQKSLSSIKPQKQSFIVTDFSSIYDFDLAGIKDKKRFLQDLLKAKDNFLETYTHDQKNFYNIKIVSQSEKKELLSFERAKSLKILDRILDKHVQNTYNKEKKRFTTNEKLKPLKDVKRQVEKLAFRDVISQIDKDYSINFSQKSLKKELRDDFYASYFLAFYMRDILNQISKGENVLKFVKSENNNGKWLLDKNTLKLSRKDEKSSLKDFVFSLNEEGFAKNIQVEGLGKITIINYLRKVFDENAKKEFISSKTTKLKNELKQNLAEELLMKMEKQIFFGNNAR